MSEKTNTKSGSRAPTGYKKRVYVSLPPEAVDKLQATALKDGRTLSAMTAIMVLRGMESCGNQES